MVKTAKSVENRSIVLIREKNGTIWICIEYRRLYAATAPGTYMMQYTDGSTDSLGEVKVFIDLDALLGYWQVPMKDEKKDNATFTFHFGTYRYTPMPFDFWNASATFQRELDTDLFRVQYKKCLDCMDELIMFFKNSRRIIMDNDGVLTLPRQARMTFTLPKF